MIQSSREAAERRAEDEKAQAASSRLWSSTLKNPRIVRVSRTLGGKDRHSKVRTVRGLRDRRIRLSVPTAIQLYALQDKLGLNQPSKVVDWLIAAAQHAIDELPPLEMSMIVLQAANDHLAAAAATTAASAPPFPQLHASMANAVVPQNYVINGGGGDGLDALLERSSKQKEALKEASSWCYPYYYQNYPMFASSSIAAAAAAAAAARTEEESNQQHKYGGQMAAGGTAAQDEALNPLRSTWNLHAVAGIPNLMVLQQKGMKSLPFPRDLRESSSYIPPRTSL